MSDQPPIEYAKSSEGYLAYQVLGDGPIDLLCVNTVLMVSVDSISEEPHWDRFDRRLASFARLIRYDRRGMGLSDGPSPATPQTIEQWTQDALVVLDAAGSTRAAVFGPTFGGLIAMMLCASFPERTTGLVLLNAFARMAAAPDYPFGTPESVLDVYKNAVTDPVASPETPDDVAALAPSLAGDAQFRAWWRRSGQRGASPATARAHITTVFESDIRSILPAIRTPTLVLHRRDNPTVPVQHGLYLAERIPHTNYVELPGGDTLPFSGDADAVLDEIEEFLTGVRPAPEPDRVLATVLFTDIVESTAQVAALGDRAWRDRLDAHDALVRRQLERFRGREINTTGDGFLATFDGPARAIHCGCAVRDGARHLGIDVRVGVHTGEVELRGDDVGGIAVHIGQRVCGAARPGEVLVSSTVKDLVAGSGISFTDRGTHTLKGIADEWRLFGAQG